MYRNASSEKIMPVEGMKIRNLKRLLTEDVFVSILKKNGYTDNDLDVEGSLKRYQRLGNKLYPGSVDEPYGWFFSVIRKRVESSRENFTVSVSISKIGQDEVRLVSNKSVTDSEGRYNASGEPEYIKVYGLYSDPLDDMARAGGEMMISDCMEKLERFEFK